MASPGRDLKALSSYLFVRSLFVEHDYFLRVISLIEFEVEKFYNRSVINFRLLEKAFKYLFIKSDSWSVSETKWLFDNVRRDRPDLAGLIDELLIGAREIIEIEVELLKDLHSIELKNRYEKDEIIEKLNDFCIQCRAHVAMKERGVLLLADQNCQMSTVEANEGDPLFGVQRVNEFEDLYQAYLDGAKRVPILGWR